MVGRYLDARGRSILTAQVALAWVMARPSVTAPVASATSVDQLEELAGAARLELRAEDVEGLNEASAEPVTLAAG